MKMIVDLEGQPGLKPWSLESQSDALLSHWSSDVGVEDRWYIYIASSILQVLAGSQYFAFDYGETISVKLRNDSYWEE